MVNVFCIVLTKDAPVYPGGFVAGHVLLKTEKNKRIKARAVRLSFRGSEEAEANRDFNDYTYRGSWDLVDKRVTLFGLPKGSDGDTIFLEAHKKYSFPFKFDIPPHCLPSIEYNKSKRIWYRLVSTIDRPWKYDIEYKLNLTVLPNVTPFSAPPQYTTEREKTLSPTACCCFGIGEVRIRIQLDKSAYWWEEPVAVNVKIDNSRCSSPINQVSACLTIVSSYRARGVVDTHEHELDRKVFPLSNGKIRANAKRERTFEHKFERTRFKTSNSRFPTSTIHGELVTHKFVVRAAVDYGSVTGRYMAELPIFMADGPARWSQTEFQRYGAAAAPPAYGVPVVMNAPPVKNPGYYPNYPSEDSNQAFTTPPSGKWPDKYE